TQPQKIRADKIDLLPNLLKQLSFDHDIALHEPFAPVPEFYTSKKENEEEDFDEFESLAKRLQNIKPIFAESSNVKNNPDISPESVIITETMAQIYESQGAFSAAIKAYEGLCKNEPDRKFYFLDKIEKIKAKNILTI
ncbi:MAG: hypothetical protein WCT77_10160, partial [Bacteroidota bacterium]